MKKLTIKMSVFLILASFCLMNCSNYEDKESDAAYLFNPDTISFPHSMKGWELYSWPNGKDWNYSILVGTNRLKTYEEIINNKIVVTGIDSLKMLLDRFPKNEYLFWIGNEWCKTCWGSNHGNFALPDNKIINEIKEYCIQKQLEFSISN